MINDILFYKNYDGVLLKCLEKDDVQKVLNDLHDGPVGGHYGAKTTAQKKLLYSYYWPTLSKDAHVYAWNWKVFQTVAGRETWPSILLKPIAISQPFQQFELDITGEITPNSTKKPKIFSSLPIISPDGWKKLCSKR